jgi:endonuclease YncB( thermonuclease family)
MHHWKRWETYRCLVLRVIDGDTITVCWENPDLQIHGPWRIRLARIDAEELRPTPTPLAVAARDYLQSLIQDQIVTIQPRRSWPDPYGRIIAEVTHAGRNISHHLLLKGLVHPYPTALIRDARNRTKGHSPTSATPTRRLITPPGTTTGNHISMPSTRTGTPTDTDTEPHQRNTDP